MPERILFFHSHIWRHYFREFLLDLRGRGSEVMVVSDLAEKHHYRHLRAAGGLQVFTPDFTRAMDFESSDAETARIESLMRSCELASGKATSRILLSAERTMGRAFSKGFFHWPSSPQARYCTDTPDGAGRMLKRQFAFLDDIFETFHPTLIITRSTSEALSLTAWFLARQRRLPLVSCRFSKLASGKAFWTTDYSMYNTDADTRFNQLLEEQTPAEPVFLQQIEDFRNKPAVVDYIADNWKKTFSPATLAKGVLHAAKKELRYYRKGCKGLKPLSTLEKAKEALRIGWCKSRHAKYFTAYSATNLDDLKYVYVPLHKEPELMLNFESPLWHDQRHMIKHLASMLPSGYRLLVKEHRFNWGRRHSPYLEYLAGLPNVSLVDPFDDQFKYIKNADLIITDNGSSGWEGVMLKRPVITLERTLYDAPGLTRQVLAPRDLDRAMIELLHSPPREAGQDHDQKIALRLQAEEETTMDIEEMLKDTTIGIDSMQRLVSKSRKQ